MLIRNAQVLTEDFTFHTQDVSFANGRFTAQADETEEVLDASGLYAIPGLLDIHLHGCVGHDFCDGTTQAFDAMAQYLAQNGVTAFHPATMTLAAETLLDICRTASTYRPARGAAFCGITMEGPFFNEKKKGGQNGAYLRTPDAELFAQLQQASGNQIGIACVAPELPNALDFIRTVSPQRTVSIAHTTADYEQAAQAFRAGASHVTHLFNAMPPFLHREPGVVGAAADFGATVEVICDGIHLHPSVVRATRKLFGDDHVVLVSDSMMATGLQDGEYALGGQRVYVKNRRATLQDGTIAGSTSNLMDCVRTAVSFGIPLEIAVKMATLNPAKVIGQSNQLGSISPGKRAHLVLLDKDLVVRHVWVDGVKNV